MSGARIVSLVAVAALMTISVGLTVDPPPAAAADSGDPVLLVVDTSGSMRGTRLSQAQSALHTSIDALANDQPAGLRSYGGSCSDGGILRVPVGLDNRQLLHDETEALSAGGGTPTPAALRAAAEDLSGGKGTVVLVSDGQSTCGDPCPVARELADTYGLDFRVHTVGFHAPDAAQGELACIAEATGGTYVSVDDEEGLADAIGNALGSGPSLGRFVVLGDSYSSGEAAGDYYPSSGKCHRSPNAWANLLAAQSEDAYLLANLACSGAVIDHVLSDGRYGEDPQIDQLRAVVQQQANTGDSVDTVLLTIGGNDLGFERFLSSCFTSRCDRYPYGSLYRSDTSTIATPLRQQIDNAAGRIEREVIPAIKSVAPDATVVLVGYPRLFPSSYSSVETCGWLQEGEVDIANALQARVDTRWVWAALDAGALFVPSQGALTGNELCTADPFLHPIMSRNWNRNQEQAHPTGLGQLFWSQWILKELQEQGFR